MASSRQRIALPDATHKPPAAATVRQRCLARPSVTSAMTRSHGNQIFTVELNVADMIIHLHNKEAKSKSSCPTWVFANHSVEAGAGEAVLSTLQDKLHVNLNPLFRQGFMDGEGACVDVLRPMQSLLANMLGESEGAEWKDTDLDQPERRQVIRMQMVDVSLATEMNERVAPMNSTPLVVEPCSLALQALSSQQACLVKGSPLRVSTRPEVTTIEQNMQRILLHNERADRRLKTILTPMPEDVREVMHGSTFGDPHTEPSVLQLLFSRPASTVLEGTSSRSWFSAKLLAAARLSAIDLHTWNDQARTSVLDALKLEHVSADAQLLSVTDQDPTSTVNWLPLFLHSPHVDDGFTITGKVTNLVQCSQTHRGDCGDNKCSFCNIWRQHQERVEDSIARGIIPSCAGILDASLDVPHVTTLEPLRGAPDRQEWLRPAASEDAFWKHHTVHLHTGMVCKVSNFISPGREASSHDIFMLPADAPPTLIRHDIEMRLNGGGGEETVSTISVKNGAFLGHQLIGSAFSLSCFYLSQVRGVRPCGILQHPISDTSCVDTFARKQWLCMAAEPAMIESLGFTKLVSARSDRVVLRHFNLVHLGCLEQSIDSLLKQSQACAKTRVLVRGFPTAPLGNCVNFSARDSAALLLYLKDTVKVASRLVLDSNERHMLDGHAVPLLFTSEDIDANMGIGKTDLDLQDFPSFRVFSISMFGGILALGLLKKECWETWDGSVVDLTRVVTSTSQFVMLSLELCLCPNNGTLSVAPAHVFGHNILAHGRNGMDVLGTLSGHRLGTMLMMSNTAPEVYLGFVARIIDTVAAEFGWLSTLCALLVLTGPPTMRTVYFRETTTVWSLLAAYAALETPLTFDGTLSSLIIVCMEAMLMEEEKAKDRNLEISFMFDTPSNLSPTRRAMAPLVEVLGPCNGILPPTQHAKQTVWSHFVQWQLTAGDVDGGIRTPPDHRGEARCTINHNLCSRSMACHRCVHLLERVDGESEEDAKVIHLLTTVPGYDTLLEYVSDLVGDADTALDFMTHCIQLQEYFVKRCVHTVESHALTTYEKSSWIQHGAFFNVTLVMIYKRRLMFLQDNSADVRTVLEWLVPSTWSCPDGMLRQQLGQRSKELMCTTRMVRDHHDSELQELLGPPACSRKTSKRASRRKRRRARRRTTDRKHAVSPTSAAPASSSSQDSVDWVHELMVRMCDPSVSAADIDAFARDHTLLSKPIFKRWKETARALTKLDKAHNWMGIESKLSSKEVEKRRWTFPEFRRRLAVHKASIHKLHGMSKMSLSEFTLEEARASLAEVQDLQECASAKNAAMKRRVAADLLFLIGELEAKESGSVDSKAEEEEDMVALSPVSVDLPMPQADEPTRKDSVDSICRRLENEFKFGGFGSLWYLPQCVLLEL